VCAEDSTTTKICVVYQTRGCCKRHECYGISDIGPHVYALLTSTCIYITHEISKKQHSADTGNIARFQKCYPLFMCEIVLMQPLLCFKMRLISPEHKKACMIGAGDVAKWSRSVRKRTSASDLVNSVITNRITSTRIMSGAKVSGLDGT